LGQSILIYTSINVNKNTTAKLVPRKVISRSYASQLFNTHHCFREVLKLSSRCLLSILSHYSWLKSVPECLIPKDTIAQFPNYNTYYLQPLDLDFSINANLTNSDISTEIFAGSLNIAGHVSHLLEYTTYYMEVQDSK